MCWSNTLSSIHADSGQWSSTCSSDAPLGARRTRHLARIRRSASGTGTTGLVGYHRNEQRAGDHERNPSRPLRRALPPLWSAIPVRWVSVLMAQNGRSARRTGPGGRVVIITWERRGSEPADLPASYYIADAGA